MSKAKNTTGNVPATKSSKAPSVIKLTKSQRLLFNKHREEIGKVLSDLSSYLSSNILAADVDTFIEELKIDVVNEDWDWDVQALEFRRREKK